MANLTQNFLCTSTLGGHWLRLTSPNCIRKVGHKGRSQKYGEWQPDFTVQQDPIIKAKRLIHIKYTCRKQSNGRNNNLS